MKIFLSLIVCIFSLSILQAQDAQSQDEITWYTWEEAYELMQDEPRKVFIDVYTDWCGWCKKMDKSTFMDSTVVEYLNDNFYPVKFDAEQKAAINFNNHEFTYVAGGRRGYHQLAHSLLNGRMGYPAFVVMDEDYSRIMISPGYKPATDIMVELEFAKEEEYKKMTFEQFKRRKS